MPELSRRTALAASAAGVVAPAFAGASPADATTRRRRGVTTFVFAAGANGVSAAPDELVLRGHRGVGVDQPGQQFRLAYQAPQDLAAFATEPSALAGVTLADQVAATVEVVRRAAAHGPVVLVGASIGGAAISLVADAVPDLIDLLVYDTAFCCVDLETPDEYMATPEAAETRVGDLLGFAAADPSVIGAVRFNWRTADRALLAKAKEAFVADGTDAEFYAFLNAMAPDDLLGKGATPARGDRARWGRVPRVYVRHLRDRIIPLELQDRMIREADAATPGNRFHVVDLDTSHVPDAAKLAELVDIYDGLTRS
ncbi:alpha/beta hydrolase [Amycolatopsis sp. WQ 127309]|uniref:alpha/beta hydrolase n=1 Tax=Amycolatopsis sp. WQ 127309 TaxID=2932773 RepID=UPI001FF106E0|nr:alpha/beta hydrolase [Amycolatopsis sp. WQ 127309]UOZ08645.1 alpha/beta hydrolase [Amycolatopsis sp. WQ 127309]